MGLRGVTLYLIRHAQADERGPKYPDDSLRPLIAKGHKQAKALAKALEVLDIRLDRLCSSPYTRALETAEPLGKKLDKEIETLSELTSSRYPQLLAQLVDKPVDNGASRPVDKGVDNSSSNVTDDSHVALIGHEPYLSELTSYLLTGDAWEVSLKFKKAMLVQLSGPLEAGKMRLHMMLPASVYKKL